MHNDREEKSAGASSTAQTRQAPGTVQEEVALCSEKKAPTEAGESPSEGVETAGAYIDSGTGVTIRLADLIKALG